MSEREREKESERVRERERVRKRVHVDQSCCDILRKDNFKACNDKIVEPFTSGV